MRFEAGESVVGDTIKGTKLRNVPPVWSPR